ncbi:hypothetical protein BV455_00440 [Parageobacillus caldoxylosilyticus]|jgi:death on curing protein|nr:hypothetical protein BV455_00440 [Parageobacillus caldoxylosilyticus]
MPQDEAIEFVVDVVNHRYSFEQIAATIKEYALERKR